MELDARMSPLTRAWQGGDKEAANTQVAMSDAL